MPNKTKIRTKKWLVALAVFLGSFVFFSRTVLAEQCGKHPGVQISISIGCKGESYPSDSYNPIYDMLFAVIRFMSIGVGLVLIGSIIVAGIQWTTSQGNPQATANALKRIVNVGTALALYLLAFALLNWLVPGGLF